MTFQGPFLISNGRNYPEKSNEMRNDLSSFFGATSYMCFTMSMTQFINKTHVEVVQTIAYFLIATYLKIVVKRHMIIISEKYPTSSNWYFSMTFTDFQWLFQANVIFPGQHQIPWLFKARLKFHDFSRLVWTMSKTVDDKTTVMMTCPVLWGRPHQCEMDMCYGRKGPAAALCIS